MVVKLKAVFDFCSGNRLELLHWLAATGKLIFDMSIGRLKNERSFTVVDKLIVNRAVNTLDYCATFSAMKVRNVSRGYAWFPGCMGASRAIFCQQNTSSLGSK